MAPAIRHWTIAIIILVIAFGAMTALSDLLERNRVSLLESYADEDLGLQGKKLRGFALGFEGVLADWYWMRSLQYVGDKVMKTSIESLDIENLRALNPRLLYPLLDNATELDPKFMAAYSYGAIVLPAVDPDQAIRLTEKGIANNPQQWRLFQYLGYIYWRMTRYNEAADAYERGSLIAGAPPFMKMMAARMRTDGGARETAREVYTQMLEQADDQQTKESASLRLLQLDSLDERDHINAALNAFRARTGRCVNNLTEIIPHLKPKLGTTARDLRVDKVRNLIDPTGVPYVLERDACTTALNPKLSRIPLN